MRGSGRTDKRCRRPSTQQQLQCSTSCAVSTAGFRRRRRAEPRPPQASLPLGFTAFSLANTSSWLAYGLLVLDDPYIWAPNVLGLGSAATQLLLILRFGRTPKSNR